MSTDRFTLNVQPPTASEETQPASYTGPFALPFDYLWRNLIIAGLVLILVLLLSALVAFIAALILNRQRQKSIVRPLAPVEAALLEVHNLKSLEVYREFGPERHYTVLSHALRQYLEHQFNRAALEMTEDEVAMMIRHEMSHVPKAETLQEVLERTSMAKFARQALTEDVALEDTDLAESFLQSEQQRLDAERRSALAEQRARAEESKAGEDRAA
jgi:TfoX/Sxy family transcriptional regulator of competence genes